MIVLQYLLGLLLTILIEFGITFLFKWRNKKIWGAVLAANLITHPSLHLIVLIVSRFTPIYFPILLLLELLIAVTEWKLMEIVMGDKSKRVLALSVTMNVASYVIGVIIQIFI